MFVEYSLEVLSMFTDDREIRASSSYICSLGVRGMFSRCSSNDRRTFVPWTDIRHMLVEFSWDVQYMFVDSIFSSSSMFAMTGYVRAPI